MSDGRNFWTREETILAFELYCTLPEGQDTVKNIEVIKLSEALGRSVNSVKLKLQNFKSYDKSYTQQGRIGLKHGSKIDEEVCREFFENWDNLVIETNDIKIKRGLVPTDATATESNMTPLGYDKKVLRSERIGQTFFRRALLAIYNNKCCFTGMDVPELLRASHIKPWSESNDINEKTNPQNGLLLNALCDVAFDNGFITISHDYVIIVSKHLLTNSSCQYFARINGRKMLLPNKFLPDEKFIEFHNDKFSRRANE